ncbi:uncharacterized protein N0V89_009755 [Didymosphaeria variabile]|uniref:Uncharacterized protein n=1 Tax=Didymosphaeria variabile TaxID=1932322 RepID=A0A9W8XFP6_9PLEO|nr:uncharacterized protein N0V89_009755 [Didymosphaeria variabile]KAJ4348381.1 hypothetical protein N0V89_009755 [Didymosphaeria variabile]
MYFLRKLGFRSSSSSSSGYGYDDAQKTRDEKYFEQYSEQVEQMLKGECILVQFGENLESMSIKAGDINPNAKRLVRALHTYGPRDSSIKLAITLPEVSRSMYETYVSWGMSVEVTALTFKWGKLILLAQTTKLLEDAESHRKTLDSMAAKGEQCKYIKHLLFQPEDWSLLRKTVHAGARCDDPTRKVVAELLKRSDGLKELLRITGKELEQMGITLKETCVVEDIVDGIEVEPAVTRVDKNKTVTVSDAESVNNTEVASITAHEQAQDEDDDEWEILSINSSHSDEGSIACDSDDSEEEDPPVAEPAVDADHWVVAPQSLAEEKPECQTDESNSSSHKYGPKTQVGNDSANDDANASTQSADDLAKQLRGLAVDEAAVSVEDVEEHDTCQEKDSEDKDGGVAIRKDFAPGYEGASPVETSENNSLSAEFDHAQYQQGTMIKCTVYTEAEMQSALAKLPGLKTSKWASTKQEKPPSPLNAEMITDLTEYMNSSTAVEKQLRNENGPTEAVGKLERDLAFAAKKEMSGLPSHPQLPVNSNADQAVPAERPTTADPNCFAGFVATKDLPRTVPASLTKVEADDKTENPVDEENEEVALPGVRRKVPGNRRQGHKRKVSEDVNLDGNAGREHARRHQTKGPTWNKKGEGLWTEYKKSALNALREKQVASTPASAYTTNRNSQASASTYLRQREEPDRQPEGVAGADAGRVTEGPPAASKEMKEDKKKDPEEWPENFAVGAPPRPKNRPETRVLVTLEKGAHYIDWNA